MILAGLVSGSLGCGSGDGGSGSTSESPEPGPTPAATPAPTERTGETLGFVVSSFGYLFPEHDGETCPDGFNWAPSDFARAGDPITDDCLAPQLDLDQRFQSLTAPGRMDGFDLDGASSSVATASEGECAHDDFDGPRGENGYDFNLWRVMGCIRGHQPGEISDTIIDNSVRDGSNTILIEVSGVDDEKNDPDVWVRVFASTDAPPTAADGSVLPFGTLTIHPEERYQSAEGPGSIVDGVVTAGPMDVRWRFNIQIVETDLGMNDGFVRLELQEDDSAKGGLFGFTSLDENYEIFGRQAGIAGAEALGYTCSGFWRALHENADGGYDPATGTCGSISVAYRFEAVRAFLAE